MCVIRATCLRRTNARRSDVVQTTPRISRCLLYTRKAHLNSRSFVTHHSIPICPVAEIRKRLESDANSSRALRFLISDSPSLTPRILLYIPLYISITSIDAPIREAPAIFVKIIAASGLEKLKLSKNFVYDCTGDVRKFCRCFCFIRISLQPESFCHSTEPLRQIKPK